MKLRQALVSRRVQATFQAPSDDEIAELDLLQQVIAHNPWVGEALIESDTSPAIMTMGERRDIANVFRAMAYNFENAEDEAFRYNISDASAKMEAVRDRITSEERKQREFTLARFK
jgi:hypothetical protein